MPFYPSDGYRIGAANRDPEDEALSWVVRQTSGDAGFDDIGEFLIWHDNPENAEAYRRAKKLLQMIDGVVAEEGAEDWHGADDAGNAPSAAGPLPIVLATPTTSPELHYDTLDDKPSRLRVQSYIKSLSRFRVVAIAASLAGACVIGAAYERDWRYDYVSHTAASSTVALPDGSRMVMAPGTAADTDFRNGARHVTLARGEAFFDVRHDPAHPFVVAGDNGVVRVVGTAFNVRREADGGATVTVLRGRVEVISGANRALIAYDRQLHFGADGLGKIRAVRAMTATAWMRGWLIAEDRPLAEVLDEVAHYRNGPVILLNGEAGRRRISAAIDIRKISEWLDGLAKSQGLRVNTVGSVKILR